MNKRIEAKLPEVCFTYLLSDYSLIGIKRGEPGYYPIQLRPEVTAASLNAASGVTPQQVMAMEAGSMFGWDCPGADPDRYTAEMAERYVKQHEERRAAALQRSGQ